MKSTRRKFIQNLGTGALRKEAVYILIFSLSTPFSVMSQNTSRQLETPQNPVMGVLTQIVSSPVLLENNMVKFNLYAPSAHEVAVTGEWMEGFGSISLDDARMKEEPIVSEKLVKGDSGIWTITLGPIKPETYSYNFILDGVKITDPNNVLSKRDGIKIFSVLLIRGKESELYAVNDVPHGTIHKIWYNSPTLGLYRRMYIYTPTGYEKSTANYPVLYLLLSGTIDEEAWITLGKANQILDNLISQVKVKPMLIVMPNGNPDQAAAPGETPFETNSTDIISNGIFEKSLVSDIIPFIESTYRVTLNKENRAIAGLSMGGEHTLKITLDNPDKFDYIGVFSAGLSTSEKLGSYILKEAGLSGSQIDKLQDMPWKDYYAIANKASINLMKESEVTDLMTRMINTDVQISHTGGGARPRKLAEKMSGSFLKFMKTGIPNGGGLPEWPKYSSVNG